MTDTGVRMRLDIWLWHARFYKTRSLASKVVKAKKVRVNGTIVSKASSQISAGDVLTFVKEKAVKVIKVVALSDRRGPYTEAVLLYEDLSPKVEKPDPDDVAHLTTINPAREKGMGRPTKKDRRAYDKLLDADD